MNRTPGLPCPREGVSVSCPVKKEASDKPERLARREVRSLRKEPGRGVFRFEL